MVRDLYPKMGFQHTNEGIDGTQVYELNVARFKAVATKINIRKETYAAESHREVAGRL
jgi:hypothetical protein